MKTTKAILIGIFTIFLMNCTWAHEKDHDLMVQQIKFFKSNIGEQITYPELAREAMIEGTVATSIKVSSTGEISVTGINGHPSLINSVKTQLEELNLTPHSILAGEEIIMKISFNIE